MIKRKFFKSFIVSLSIASLIGTSVFAKGSNWSKKYLLDGKMGGVIPIEEQIEEKDYSKNITVDELKYIIKESKSKIDDLKLEKNKNFTEILTINGTTRDEVLRNVYNMVAAYDSKCSGKDYITYLQDNKILFGDGNSNDLARPATYEEAATFFVRGIQKIYNDNSLGSKGVFYKIEKNGNTAYLFGSIHIGDFSMYPINKNVMEAYRNSNELFVEVNLQNKENQKLLASLANRTDNLTLRDDLGDKLYNRLKNYFDTINIPEELYKNSKISTAYNSLNMIAISKEIPNATALGVDNYFMSYANIDSKNISELESAKSQMEVLESTPVKTYKELISKTLDSLEKDNGTKIIIGPLIEIMRLWNEGDVEKLENIIKKDSSAASNTLLANRDKEMAEKIDSLLKNGRNKKYFIVVGAAHYAPEDSIRKYLTDLGYTVEDLNK